MGSPKVEFGTAWNIYRHIVQKLQDITARRADEDQDYVDAVVQWQVSEFLQDEGAEAEPDVPYPRMEGRELYGGYESPREDGSIYLGGVNEGRGLGMLGLPALTIS